MLDTNIKYTCIDKKYIPLIDGGGTTCDNCSRLISNIATVRSINGINHIGFDCLETILIRSGLLDNFNEDDFIKTKKSISKIIRFSKSIKKTIEDNKHLNITGLLIEYPPLYCPEIITYYRLFDNKKESRDNDYIKLKEVNFNFLISTLKNIFPKLEIIIK